MAAAVVKFSNNNKDPKAQIIPTTNFVSGELITSLLMFYDGPSPVGGVYDDFLAIPAISNTLANGTFFDLVSSFQAPPIR